MAQFSKEVLSLDDDAGINFLCGEWFKLEWPPWYPTTLAEVSLQATGVRVSHRDLGVFGVGVPLDAEAFLRAENRWDGGRDGPHGYACGVHMVGGGGVRELVSGIDPEVGRQTMCVRSCYWRSILP